MLLPLAASSTVLYLYIRTTGTPSRTHYSDDEAYLNIPPLNFTPPPPPENLLLYPPLRTSGRYLLDAQNQEFTLASINWYGASDERYIPSGLDIQHRSSISALIRSLGFNSVRLPYSDEMVLMDPPIPDNMLAANPDLFGLRALDIYIAVIESLTDAGIAVIPNNHITQATWCCGVNPCDASWRNDYLFLDSVCRVPQSEQQWFDNWVTIMRPHLTNPLVIGADLRNEVRGLWGTMPWHSWPVAAEKAGNMLLTMRDDWLIIVEGTSSSNDLSGVRSRPVVFNVPDRVVYSAHIYGWSGWGSLGGPYARREYTSFRESMLENWAYLLEEDIAPVWVSEFGAARAPVGEGDVNYWGNLMRFLREVKDGGGLGFAYWALNPRKPSGDEDEMYGLVRDDWKGLVWDYRMRDLRALME